MKFEKKSHIISLSRNDIAALASFVVNAPYGTVRNFLSEDIIRFVNHGVYGWNYRVYFIHPNDIPFCTIAVCEGYRNMPGDSIPTELLDEYADMYMPFDNNADFADFLYKNWLKYDDNEGGC